MLVVPPTTQKSTETERTVAKALGKALRHNETVQSIGKAWMPYHRIWISCTDTRRLEHVRVVTALNALFCTLARTERELLQLFRPRHLKITLREMNAGPNELVCTHSEADLSAIVDRLQTMRAEARDQLAQIKRQHDNEPRKMQWQYLLIPRSTRSFQREEETSARLGELQSRSLAVEICLNLTGTLVPQNIAEHDIIYVPMAIARVENENASSRHVLVDLATGRLDAALTDLCGASSDFGSRLKIALQR